MPPSPLPADRLPEAREVLAEFTLEPGGRIRPRDLPAGAAPRYRILRTLEVDAYDEPVPAADIRALTVSRAPPPGNDFKGKSRKAAKISIADAPMEDFADLSKLISTLPGHQKMKKHPGISTAPTSDRVAEEKRNVRVDCFLYAASREDDNDFHLIVGRAPELAEKYLTVEISGLPPAAAASFVALKAARDAFFAFFGSNLPGTSYDFYDPPIPVRLEGSLFFDFSHAKGSRPGPQRLRKKMPVVWEIHPVSRIVFEP